MALLYDLAAIGDARRAFLDAVAAALEPRAAATEIVSVYDAVGRVTAADVTARVEVPGFTRSTVDGYAVRARDTFGASDGLPAYLEVVADVPMGVPAGVGLGPGQCARVATGGMLPDGADAVLMLEYAEALDALTIGAVRPVTPGENVIRRGEDIRPGDILLRRGHRLRPQDLGALAGVGVEEVCVFRRPRVAVISTGDEVVPPAREPGPGQVRDMNGASLCAAVAREGGIPQYLGIVPDEAPLLEAALREAISALRCDMVLISGGSSVGARDVAAEVINAAGPPGVIVHGVALKPGKPTILACCGPVPVLGIPGHPVSALVVFDLFARPALALVAGCAGPSPWTPTVRARLSRNLASPPGLEEHVRVALRAGPGAAGFPDGTVWADPVLGKSGLISTLVRADGLIVIPQGSEGLEQGAEVEVRLV